MEHKVVLLTGASSGIGAHAAQHLAKTGYRKLSLVARRKEELEKVANLCRANGASDVLVLTKDLSINEQCVETVDETIKHFGGLDILICNAGDTASLGIHVRNMRPEDFQQDLFLNVMAPFILTKHALPHLEKTKGNILYVSTVSAHKPSAGLASYCSSKAAMEQLARVVALEEASKGVRINVVRPGHISSGLHVKHGRSESVELAKEAFKGVQPLGRIGELQEMSDMIEFLISEKNSFMTGSVVDIDGGYLLK